MPWEPQFFKLVCLYYSVNEFRLFNWLGQQEDMHRMTLYQCDYTMTKWTKSCIRQADCILILAMAESDPAMREVMGPRHEVQTINVTLNYVHLSADKEMHT